MKRFTFWKTTKPKNSNTSANGALSKLRGKWESKTQNRMWEKRNSCTHTSLPVTCTRDKVDTLGTKRKLFREIAQHFKAVTVTLKCFLNLVIKEINAEKNSSKPQKSLGNWPQSCWLQSTWLPAAQIQYTTDSHIGELTLTLTGWEPKRGGGSGTGSGTGSGLHLLINQSIQSHLKCLLKLFCRSHEPVDQWLYSPRGMIWKPRRRPAAWPAFPYFAVWHPSSRRPHNL